MKLLLFEYITGGGLVDQNLPASLACEGEMMIRAVANDFESMPNIDVFTLHDYRLSTTEYSKNDCVIKRGRKIIEEIDKLISKIDALLIIAPESNNILATLCGHYEDRILLLNCRCDAIRLASNKQNTYSFLSKANINHIMTRSIENISDISTSRYVVKPVDGVGCEDILLAEDHKEIIKYIEHNSHRDFVIQPLINGRHVSLNMMCWDGDCFLLSANEQIIKEGENTFMLEGCRVNALDKKQFENFAKEICKAIPGLRGYVGIDILIKYDQIMLVDINPRITTSYVGLRSALGINPAKCILQSFMQQKLIPLKHMKNECITVKIENGFET